LLGTRDAIKNALIGTMPLKATALTASRRECRIPPDSGSGEQKLADMKSTN
jgi:hypothetical protein